MKEICRFSFSCCGNDIDYTDSCKYLGIEFTEHLSWIKLVDNFAISANRAAIYLIAKATNSGALVYEVFTHLYSMLVLPIIEYSSFLWGHTPYTQTAKVQNILVRSFLGVNRSAPTVAMLGDMGWLSMLTITQISCVRFWLRLTKMSENRLNQKIFTEAHRWACMGYKNWIARTLDILNKDRSELDLNPMCTLDNNPDIHQYKECLVARLRNEWQKEINRIPEGSESGGRLGMYRRIKKEPAPEIYVVSKNSVGVRRVIAGLRLGCLPLAVEVGRYTGTPYIERVCRLCGTGEVEDQNHFLINCPSLSHIRQKIFMHCNSILRSFSQESSFNKCKFLLCNADGTALFLIYKMYQLRQSVLYNQ